MQNVYDNNKRRRLISDDDYDNDHNEFKRRRTNNDDNDDNNIKHYHCGMKYPDKYDNSIFKAGAREIHFNAHVDGETIAKIKKIISNIVDEHKDKLVKFEKDGSIPSNRAKDPPIVITIVINSPGGGVHDVLDFVDYINLLRCTFSNIKFTSIISGLVASAGTIMGAICDKKQMTRFAFAMIHELSCNIARNTFTRLRTHGEFLQNVHNVLVTIYQESRGIDINDVEKKRELEKMLLDETWMTAEEYKKHGFVDEIIADHRHL